MKFFALIAAVAIVIVPAATLASPSPDSSVRSVHPIVTPPTAAPPSSSPSLAPCDVLFYLPPQPVPSGQPAEAERARNFGIAGYVVKNVPSGREVYATASSDPTLAATLAEDVAQKTPFSKIEFKCGTENYVVTNSIVTTSTLTGNTRHFTVPVPGIREPVRIER